MVIETEITRMLGIENPIIAAPMGPFYTTKLTVAISEAGGLGVLSHITMHGINSTEEMKKSMEFVVEHTDKPFGFNIRTARSQPDSKILSRNLPKVIMNNPKIKEQCIYLITSAGSPKMIYNKHFEKLKESDVTAYLKVWDDMWHTWPLYADFPEADEAIKEIDDFIRQRMNVG